MAHNFTVGRLGTAMLEADPDAVDAPMRRTRNGTYVGLGIGALLCVGFLVFGLIFPGGATSWRQEGRIVVDRDGGATYLYSGGVLRPVANLASARLALGEGADTSLVSQRSLEGETMGGPVGIAGAPDGLPEAGAQGVGRLCAVAPDGEEEAPRGRTALVVGEAPPPWIPGPGDGVLVSGPDGTAHLLWQGTRLRMDEESGGVQALGYGTTPALPVDSAFLNTVPEGPDLVAPPVAGAGEEGRELAGAARAVGQVFAVATPGQEDQHYLLTRDGLAPLTLTQALLLLGDTGVSAQAYGGASPEPIALTSAEVHANLAPDPETTAAAEGLPPGPPAALEVGAGVPCLRWETDGSMALTMDAPAGIRAWPVPERPFVQPGCTEDEAVPLPTSLLRVLPTGPLLSQEAASLPLASSPRGGGTACP